MSPGFSNRTQADADITKMADSLRSFHRLTDLIFSRSGLTYPFRWPTDAAATLTLQKKDVEEIGNMEIEFQTIGFKNMPHYVRGYIDYSEFRNLELEFELARAKSQPQASINKQLESKKGVH